ncbi:MAG: GGDEF domain-containing protein [Vitreimonas sp.]
MTQQAQTLKSNAIELAQKALAQLAKLGIDPTPANYELWFLHLSGASADLSAEIERLGGKRFTPEACADLYERHVAKTLSGRFIETGESIARELSDVIAALRAEGDQSGAYALALDQASVAFEGALDPAVLKALIGGLASATRRMMVSNGELRQRVSVSTDQIERLQATLEDVRIEALTDPLTGLANRRAFDAALAKRIGEISGDLCLLLCDIDHFKRFNDTWGHGVGDSVIRFIANTLKSHANGEYLAARYGGEEFALIMPRTNMHRAQAIAGALRQAIKAKRLTRKSTGESIGAVTVSIGIARRRISDSASALLGRADQCLYASKDGGRDRITIDSDLSAAA